MAKDEDYIQIGMIRRRRGNRGEIVVEPMTSDRERYLALKRILIGPDPGKLKAFSVEEVWFHGKKTVMKLEGIDSISHADTLKGFGIYLPESERIELPSDTYFQDDLIGMEVVDDALGVIGKVTSILETGGTDLLVIERAGKEVLLPAAKRVCREVDLKNGRIHVHLEEEFYTINEV